MRRSLAVSVVSAAIVLFTVSAAEAATCASTFGSGDSYGTPAWVVRGSGAGPKFDEAFSFTPSVDCGVGTIDLAFHLESGPNGLSISVVEDSAGLPGGTVVESTTVIDQMTTDTGGSVVVGTFSGVEVLSGGTTYWIVVEAEPGTGGTSAVWHQNDQGLTSVRGFRQSDGSWQGFAGNSDGAYRVSSLPPVPAVPSLSPWSLVAMGAVLAFLGSRPLLPRSARVR